MTAELPSLDLAGDTPECSVPKRAGSRQNVKSAIESSRSRRDPEADLLESTNNRKGKRNSDGQVLQVKFADDLVVPTVEIKKPVPMVPGSNSFVNVDHTHYEQWARVPATGRKVTKSTLLRGIQQLKARMKREETNMEIVGLGKQQNGPRNEQHLLESEENKYHIKELKRNILLTSDKVPEDKYIQVRRDRTQSAIENVVLKAAGPPRNQLKPNSQVIDSGVFKLENDSVTPDAEVRLSRNHDRDSAKLRHGVSRIRDRSAFPISVYQPININDQIFLINEPAKDSDMSNLKITEPGDKKETRTSTMLVLTDKLKQKAVLKKAPELHVHLDMILGGKPVNVRNSFQRSKTMTGGLLPSRVQKRTQFVVSSAELYDFSQLAEIRHSMADKPLERSKTDFLLPNKSIRNGYKVYNE